MLKVKCPSCQVVSALPEAFVGKAVRCKKCNTRFTADTASTDGGVITVYARRIGGTQSNVFQKETTVGGAGFPGAGPPRPSSARWLLPVLAVALPVLLAGAFVAYKMLTRESTEGGPAAAAEVYGGIEISSTGVKSTVVEIFPDPDLGYDYRILDKKQFRTSLLQGMETRQAFDPQGLREAVDAVQAFFQQLTRERNIPASKVFIVAGSGLLKTVRGRKDLDEKAKEELIEKNQSALADAITRATGNKVEFITVRKEVELQIGGLVPPRHRDASMLIDVGSSATRGGYRDPESGLYVIFELPGVKEFGKKIAAAAGAEPLPDVAARLAEKEVRRPLREQIERKPEMLKRRRVYLTGGIPWVMTTYQQPDKRNLPHVPVGADDIDAFGKLVRANKELPPRPLPSGMDPRLQAKVEKDLALMPKIFSRHQDLLAGGEILKALSDELKFRAPQHAQYFPSFEADVSWLLGYIAENRPASK
ncbi:MAG: hypothetical protein IT429_07810 [Gemmataceae bacterium]|nr:hypothetical protein [Gemmataceae bacterium]